MKASSASKNFFMIFPPRRKPQPDVLPPFSVFSFSLYNFPAAAARTAISPSLLL